MVLYTEKPKDSPKKQSNKQTNKTFLELTNEFIKVMVYKINTQKSMSKLKWKVRKQVILKYYNTMALKSIIHLGIY